jgi:hypothetical protein
MKILRLFLTASFLISLLAGITAGTFLFHKENSSTRTLSSNPPPSLNEQKGIWLIAVDRLNIVSPKIEGIWLLTYIPNYTSVKPLPFIPSGNKQQDAELTKAFKITAKHKIAPEFLDLLQKKGHVFRDYIVFDEVAAVSIINNYGGVSIQGERLSGLDALTQIPKIWDDPQESLLGQVIVMDHVCKSLFSGQSLPDFDKLQNNISSHIISNLDLGKKTIEWQKNLDGGSKKICDFSDLYEKIKFTSRP